jgi:hypothetical protein
VYPAFHSPHPLHSCYFQLFFSSSPLFPIFSFSPFFLHSYSFPLNMSPTLPTHSPSPVYISSPPFSFTFYILFIFPLSIFPFSPFFLHYTPPLDICLPRFLPTLPPFSTYHLPPFPIFSFSSFFVHFLLLPSSFASHASYILSLLFLHIIFSLFLYFQFSILLILLIFALYPPFLYFLLFFSHISFYPLS